MSDIKFRLLENVFERKKEQTGYFIGEQKKERYDGEKFNEIILFSFTPEITNIIYGTAFEELTLLDARKINDTYTISNISLNNKWSPFQQWYVRLEALDYVYPLYKFGKDTLKELLNFEGEYGYQYAELVNNTDENSAANE
jgi:hypothetical protein